MHKIFIDKKQITKPIINEGSSQAGKTIWWEQKFLNDVVKNKKKMKEKFRDIVEIEMSDDEDDRWYVFRNNKKKEMILSKKIYIISLINATKEQINKLEFALNYYGLNINIPRTSVSKIMINIDDSVLNEEMFIKIMEYTNLEYFETFDNYYNLE